MRTNIVVSLCCAVCQLLFECNLSNKIRFFLNSSTNCFFFSTRKLLFTRKCNYMSLKRARDRECVMTIQGNWEQIIRNEIWFNHSSSFLTKPLQKVKLVENATSPFSLIDLNYINTNNIIPHNGTVNFDVRT